jgi:RNA-binding protein
MKQKKQKKAFSGAIEDQTGSQLVGIIGHTAIFYRESRTPHKRKISLPVKKP